MCKNMLHLFTYLNSFEWHEIQISAETLKKNNSSNKPLILRLIAENPKEKYGKWLGSFAR